MRKEMTKVVVLVTVATLATVALAVCPEACVCRRGVVNCANKDFSHVPDNIPQDAVEIDLASNRINFIPNDAFNHLQQLTKLDLSNNLLETLSFSPFIGLPSLQKLKLDKNPLVCDCRVRWIAGLVQGSVTSPSPICQGPPSRKNQSVLILTSLCIQTNSLISNEALENTVHEVRIQVNSAVENTMHDIRRLKRAAPNSHEMMKYNRYPLNSAVSLSKAAAIYEQTIEKLLQEINSGVYFNITFDKHKIYQEVLTEDQLTLLSLLSGCTEHRHVLKTCTDPCFNQKYRSINGVCNNLYENNIMYGASLIPLKRLLPARYENNFNLPIGWNKDKLYNGVKIPSPRKVSIDFLSSKKDTSDPQFTHLFTQWGQFLTHDIDLSPTSISNAKFSDGRFCNETCISESPCFPIPVASDDPRVTSQPCIGFVRSTSMCGTGITSGMFEKTEMHRQQVNVITSFVDASMVYGSLEEQASGLRETNPDEGLLKVGAQSKYNSQKTLLPVVEGDSKEYQTGDVRANEQLGLTVMHIIWFREHNRLAKLLKTVNPQLDGDNIYHETRKIVGAMMQHITYKHWLPKVIGPSGIKKIGVYKGYKSSVDPSIANAFSTAAFRFGHAYVKATLHRLDANFKPIKEGNLMLHEAFFAPQRIVNEGGIDPILRGLFATPAKQSIPGDFVTDEMTEKLFTFQNKIAQDLAAFNVQRGRDHGLPSYNAYRKLCGLREAVMFDDLSREISSKMARTKLEVLYGHPDNVDLFVGGLAEDSIKGARVGETFACIIADQFKRLRDGDRFWYENPGVFRDDQLQEIKNSNLSRIICDNSDGIMNVQKDVFTLTTSHSDYLSCSSSNIPLFNIAPWSQCCEACPSS